MADESGPIGPGCSRFVREPRPYRGAAGVRIHSRVPLHRGRRDRVRVDARDWLATHPRDRSGTVGIGPRPSNWRARLPVSSALPVVAGVLRPSAGRGYLDHKYLLLEVKKAKA